MVKWRLVFASAGCLALSFAPLRAQEAARLQTEGNNAMARGDYKTAAADFDKVVTTYPSTPNIEDITIRAGFAFLHSDDFLKAISELQKLAAPTADPKFRAKALFFTGLAQFSQAHKLGGDPGKEFYRAGRETLTTLIDFLTKDPAADKSDKSELLESAMYYRALCAYGQEKYEDSEGYINDLITSFPRSLQKPDYLLLLGSIYAVQANDAINAKATVEQVNAIAQKAIAAFEQVVNDPNAQVQGNEANMREGEILYLMAQTDPALYTKALDVFRRVKRKEDMVAAQQARIDDLRKSQANALQNGGVTAATVSNMTALILDREAARLKDLQAGPDPIIQALLRMAECYIGLKDADSARTILHRLHGATLPPDQQQELDLQLLLTYTLGGEAEKANAALDAYLKAHPGDPNADSISVQIGQALMKRQPPDYEGALEQAKRSLVDFPNGKAVGQAITLEAAALEKLGRVKESQTVTDDYLKAHPDSPMVYALLLTQGQGQMNTGDLKDAVATFIKIRDAPKAGPYAASADAFLVQTYNHMHDWANVVAESKNFAAKFGATDNAAPSVAVLGAMAMDKLNDPNAVPALQAVPKMKFANDDIRQQMGSYALYYIVTIYQRQNKTAEMIQAVNDLRTQFPKAYALISQASDAVTVVLEKQKKFEDAVALYTPLLTVDVKNVAADAQNKIGKIWYDAAKAMGAYQSLQTDAGRTEAEKRMSSSEGAYAATIKNFPDQLNAVGDAFQGLIDTGTQRVKWGLLKDTDLEGYLAKQVGDVTGEMAARLELAKAGLVFVIKNGHQQDAAALDRMTKAIASSPGLKLTTQEADQYGTLLINAGKFDDALKVYNALLAESGPNEVVKLAGAYYGLAAVNLAQKNYADAKANLNKMFLLPGGGAWSPHIGDAQLGMAEIEEQSSDPSDLAAAKSTFSSIMTSPVSGAHNQAEAMLGYGRVLEKEGHAVKAAGQQDIEFATHYYEQVDLFFGAALPDESAEGLYLAAQAYTKAGDTADAQKATAKLKSPAYANTDWAKK